MLLLASPLRAEDDPAPAPAPAPALRGEALRHQVTKWIEGLRADDYAVREAARRGLKRYARQAQALIAAAADDPDPEVQRTLRSLLGPAVIPRPTPVRAGDFSKLLLVSFDYKNQFVSDAIADFGRRHGGSFDVPESHAARRVTAKVTNVPYFAGLLALLKAAGLFMDASFSAAGVASLAEAQPGADGAIPMEAAGPLLVRVVSRQTTLRFGHPPPAPSYALTLQIWWPPSVQVNQLRSPRVEVARDEKAQEFTTTRARTSYGLSPSMYSRDINVTLHPSQADHGSKLAALELVVPLRLRHGRKTRSTTKTDALPVVLDAQGAVTDKLGTDGSVEFRSLAQQENRATLWIAEITAVLKDDVARQSAQVALETGGRAVATYIATSRSESADGTLHLTARAYSAGEERPTRVLLHWFTKEEDGNVRVRFENIALR